MTHSDWIASPGMGTTPAILSCEPLATEGDATDGPDDEVNFDELGDASFGEGPAPTLDIDLDGEPDVAPPSFGLPPFDARIDEFGGEW